MTQLPVPPTVDSGLNDLDHTHNEDFRALTEAVRAAYAALGRIQSACPTKIMLESMGYTGSCVEVTHPPRNSNNDLVKVVVFHQQGYHVTFCPPRPPCDEDAISIRSDQSVSTDWEAEYNIQPDVGNLIPPSSPVCNPVDNTVPPSSSVHNPDTGPGNHLILPPSLVLSPDDCIAPPSRPGTNPEINPEILDDSKAASTTNINDRWYSVTVGRRPGVFHGPETIQDNVTGIKGFSLRRFPSQALAQADYDKFLDAGLVKQVTMEVVAHTITR